MVCFCRAVFSQVRAQECDCDDVAPSSDYTCQQQVSYGCVAKRVDGGWTGRKMSVNMGLRRKSSGSAKLPGSKMEDSAGRHAVNALLVEREAVPKTHATALM